MGDRHALDDAAAAALLNLAMARDEHIGLLYEENGKLARTPAQSRSRQREARGRFVIPQGSARAIYHNHPSLGEMKNAPARAKFSDDDINQARALGVPSYISAGDKVMRYDPKTRRAEEVLAQIPMDEQRRKIMVEILQRDPDDPRGARR